MNPCLPPYNHNVPRKKPSGDFHVCVICGDRFHSESSLKFHTKRRSMQTVHLCKQRGCSVVSYNRCQFLSHRQQHSDTDFEVIPIEQELMALGSLSVEDSDSPSTGVSSSMQSVDRDLSEVSHNKIETQVTHISQILSPTETDIPMQNNTQTVPTESIHSLASLEMDALSSPDVDPINPEQIVEVGGGKVPSSKEASGTESLNKIHSESNTQVFKISQKYCTILGDPTKKKTSIVQFKLVTSHGTVSMGVPYSSNSQPLISSEKAVDDGDKVDSSNESSEVNHDNINMQVMTITQNDHPTTEHLTIQNNTSSGALESVEDSFNQNVDASLPSNGTNCLEVVMDPENESSLDESSGRGALEASHDDINLPVMNNNQKNERKVDQLPVEKKTSEIPPEPDLHTDSVTTENSDSTDVALQPTNQIDYLDEAIDGGVEKMCSPNESGGKTASNMTCDEKNMQVMTISKNYDQTEKCLLTQKNTLYLSESVIAFGSPSSNTANNLEGSVNVGGEQISSCNKSDGTCSPHVNHDKIKNISQKNCFAVENLHTGSNTSAAKSWAHCPECKGELTTDIRNHFQRGVRNFKCRYGCTKCHLFLPNPCSLSAHTRYHHRQRPFVCPECGDCCNLWGLFLVHLQFKCFHRDRFLCSKCPKCGSLFADDMSLKNHIFNEHVKVAYKCESCTVLCHKMAPIEQHKITVHGRQDIQTAVFRHCQLCNICMKPPMLQFDHIATHMKNIHYIYGFKCVKCNTLFEKRSCFSEHSCKNNSSVYNTKIVSNDESVTGNNIMRSLSIPRKCLLIIRENNANCNKNSNDVMNYSSSENNSDESTGINNEGKIKNLSEAAQFKSPISQTFTQQKAMTCLDKSTTKNVSKSTVNGHAVNAKILQNCYSDTENVKKNTGSLSFKSGDSFIKVRRIVKKCVSCKNVNIFSCPLEMPLELLPSRCTSCLNKSVKTPTDVRTETGRTKMKADNCLKKSVPTLINRSTSKARMKTRVSEKTNKKPYVSSAASNLNSAVSHDLDLNTKNEGSLVNTRQITSTAKNYCITNLKLNGLRERKDSAAENASEEIAENRNVETVENPDPAPKCKRIKLNKKEVTLLSMSFAPERFIHPVTESSGVYNCFKCDFSHSSKSEFETHVLTHKTDSSSFQCMECGMCFSMQPSFGKHLLDFHNITDTEKYIGENPNCKGDTNNRCNGGMSSEENRCSVCRVVYESSTELNSHFRSHGMAFLLKIRNERTENGKHLSASRNITDTEKDISENPNCKGDSSNQCKGGVSSEENRCSVCHAVYESSTELNSHFRSHGMAFLLKIQNKHR